MFHSSYCHYTIDIGFSSSRYTLHNTRTLERHHSPFALLLYRGVSRQLYYALLQAYFIHSMEIRELLHIICTYVYDYILKI